MAIYRIVANPEAEANRDKSALYTLDDWVVNDTARVYSMYLDDQLVWAVSADRIPTTYYVTVEQAEALRLCLYHLCGQPAEYIQVAGSRCRRHADFGAAELPPKGV